MYKAGDLNVSDPLEPEDETGYQEGGVYDSRATNSGDKIHGAYLNHSCGEWVIGGIEQIDALIADLQRARVLLDSLALPPAKDRS